MENLTATQVSDTYIDNIGMTRTQEITRSPLGAYLVQLRRSYIRPEKESDAFETPHISPRRGIIAASKPTGTFEASGTGISACEVSLAIGKSKYLVTSYESGYTHPSEDVARRLARFFNVDEEDMVQRVAHSKATWGKKKKGVRGLELTEEAEAIARSYSHVIRGSVSYEDLKWLHNKAVQKKCSLSKVIGDTLRAARLAETSNTATRDKALRNLNQINNSLIGKEPNRI